MPRVLSLVLCSCLFSGVIAAQGVREHTRPSRTAGTAVSESQASDLTLTLSTATSRLVQTWVRTAGTIDRSGKILTAALAGPEAALVKVGQRLRAFPPSSKSSMYQAYVTRVIATPGGAAVEASLSGSGRQNTVHYVMEIVVERGPFLAIPNEAIIEEGDRRVVYVQRTAGQYVPQEIQTGIQGELLTEIVDGLHEGDQVVTFGSFFIDAEHKLKATDIGPLDQKAPAGPMSDDHRRP
jgi:Cu(I)/Ag(I) efflux system membrane fusion protein